MTIKELATVALRVAEREREIAFCNLGRAMKAFENMTPMQMEEKHGESGETRREVLTRYHRAIDEITETIVWLKNLAGVE